MSFLGKDEKILISTEPPAERKEALVSRLLKEATQQDDWTLVNFMLCHCWNKERIFVTTSKEDGIGLLHHAVRNNFPNTVRVLIEHGVNVNYRNKEGNTSLQVAAQFGHQAVVELLIESGCNPFIENSVGKQAIDCIGDCASSGEGKINSHIKESLRKYAVKCSRVKLMKNLETWKNIVAEEERSAEEMMKKRAMKAARVTKPRRKTSVIQVPTLKRTDSGIISDFDSDKSYSSLASSSSTNNNARHQTDSDKESIDKKLGKSKSFSVRDITTQYTANMTNALRKLSSHAKGVGSSESYNKTVTDSNSGMQRKSSSQVTSKQSTGGGMKVTSLYGGDTTTTKKPNSNKRRKKIDRTHRMSLPLLPIFAPPESYI